MLVIGVLILVSCAGVWDISYIKRQTLAQWYATRTNYKGACTRLCYRYIVIYCSIVVSGAVYQGCGHERVHVRGQGRVQGCYIWGLYQGRGLVRGHVCIT